MHLRSAHKYSKGARDARSPVVRRQSRQLIVPAKIQISVSETLRAAIYPSTALDPWSPRRSCDCPEVARVLQFDGKTLTLKLTLIQRPYKCLMLA